jgi:hypothetical protein
MSNNLYYGNGVSGIIVESWGSFINNNNVNDNVNVSNFILDFSDSSDIRTERNFEQLITERGSMVAENEVTTEQRNYNEIFENIKDKIFILQEHYEIELLESEKENFSKKYNIPDVTSVINKLKKDVSILFVKKTELDITISERKNLYMLFCNNINSSLKCINDMVPEKTNEDIKLKEILQDRIEWYYKELGIEKLIDDEYKIKSEFEFLKKTMIQLSGISVPGLCSICLEHQVSWFIDPCGHTICNNCKLNTEKNNNCHYCRSKKTKLNRIYL